MEVEDFQKIVRKYYQEHGRDLPWRQEPLDPYHILVSEIMLQQTQVSRVIPKYEAFIRQFPSVHAVARASLAEVLRAWNGLGYNRRAKYLHEAMKALVAKEHPWTLEDLTGCKGIGLNTAAAVLTYAYNQPLAFVETNIRTVYIHHYFPDLGTVTDKQIIALLETSLDRTNPREFMWALMDYGSYLKRAVGNTARNSRHYAKQSKFEGSRRQLRGQIIKVLASHPQRLSQLLAVIPDKRLPGVLHDLCAEGLITGQDNKFLLTR